MGRANRRELLLFPLPIVPLAISFSLSPALPTIQRGLCRGESCKGQNHILLSNKYVSIVSYQTLKTTNMKFEKLLVYLASFQKPIIAIRLNLLQVCPSVPQFVFTVLLKPSCNVFSDYFYVSLDLVAVPPFLILIKFMTQLH